MLSRLYGLLTCFILMLGLTGYSGPVPPNAPPPLGPESGLTTAGPDEYGYELTDEITIPFIDISPSSGGTGTALVYSDLDDGTAILSSRPFDYYSSLNLSTIYINVNGFISFEPLTRKTDVPKPFPTDSKPNNMIAPFWYDLSLASGGKVYYKNDDLNACTIIQWEDAYSATTGVVTFEVILYDSGNIEFIYQANANTFSGVTAGIEDADGVAGLNYGITDLTVARSVRITRPVAGIHFKARPQVSSSFFDNDEAWFSVNVTNTTDSASTPDSYTLAYEVLESDPGDPDLWDLVFYNPACTSEITSLDDLAKGASTVLCMRVTVAGDQIPGYYARIKVTLTSQTDVNRSSVIYLQPNIGSPFVQLYQDSTSGLNLDFTNQEGRTTLEMANPYGGSHMAMNMLRPGHYMVTWLEGSKIYYRMYDEYPGLLGEKMSIDASPDDSRNLIDLTPAVAGSRDGFGGILYIVNQFRTNGLGQTELNANVYYTLVNPDGTIVTTEEGDPMYPLNMTNNSAWLNLVTGYPSGQEAPQFQDPRIVPVGQDKMGLVWKTNYFPSGGSSLDRIQYVIAKTDGSDYTYSDIPGWESPPNRHVYPATSYLDDGRFVISYIHYTGYANPWAIDYAVINTDGTPFFTGETIPGTDGWQVDLIQLGTGQLFFCWQDLDTSAITYAIVQSDLQGLDVTPTILTYEDYPGHTNYRAGGFPSVTRSTDGTAILTWQDQDWQEQLYYALIGSDGSELTPTSLYRRVGSTLPESQISTNDYGNAPLADEKTYNSAVFVNFKLRIRYLLPLIFN